MAEHWYGVAQTKEDCIHLQRSGRRKKITIITCSLEARAFMQDSGDNFLYVWDLFDMEKLIDSSFFKAKALVLADSHGDLLYKKAGLHRLHVEFLSHAVAASELSRHVVAWVSKQGGALVISKTKHIFFGAYFPQAQKLMHDNPLLAEFLAETAEHVGLKFVRSGMDLFTAKIWASFACHRAIAKQFLLDLTELLVGALLAKPSIDDITVMEKVEVMTVGWGRDLHRMLSLSQLSRSLKKKAVHVVWRPSKLSENDQKIPAIKIREQVKKGVAYGPTPSMFGLKRWRTLLSFYREAPYKAAFSKYLGKVGTNLVYRNNIIFNAFFSYREVYLTHLLTSEIIQKYQPQIMLGSDSGGESARAEMIAAQSLGVKAFSTPHGYQAYAMESYNYLADTVLTFGEATAHILSHCGVSDQKIKTVGSGHPRAEAKLSFEGRVKVVIGTRSWGGLWSNYSSVHPELDNIFNGLLSAFVQDHRYDVTIKSHPNGDLHGYYDSLVARNNSSKMRHISRGWGVARFSEACDVLICLGDCPSLFVSALYLNIPIIFCDGSMSITQKKMGYNFQGVIVESSASGVYKACQRMRDDKAFLKESLVRQSKFAQSFGSTQFPDQVVGQLFNNSHV